MLGAQQVVAQSSSAPHQDSIQGDAEDSNDCGANGTQGHTEPEGSGMQLPCSWVPVGKAG